MKNNDNFIGNIDVEEIKTFKHSLSSDEIKLSDVIKTEEQLNLFLDCDKLFNFKQSLHVTKSNNDLNKIHVVEAGVGLIMEVLFSFPDLFKHDYSEKELYFIKKMVTIYVLEHYMENNKSIRKSIYDYCKKESAYPDMPAEIDEKKLAEMERGKVKLRDNLAQQNEQAKKEGIHYKRAPYKNDKTTLYSPMDLAFMDKDWNPFLELHNVIFYKEGRTVREATLIKQWKHAYERFNKVSSEITLDIELYREMFNKGERDDIGAKEAINFIACILMTMKFERTYRTSFLAKLAKYTLENNYSLDSLDSIFLKATLGRCNAPGMHLGFFSEIPWGYKDIFEKLYVGDLENKHATDVILKIRNFIYFAYSMFIKELDCEYFQGWNDDDFIDAFEYIVDIDEIGEIFEEIKIDECEDDYIECVRKMYKSDIFYKDSVDECREKLSDKKIVRKRIQQRKSQERKLRKEKEKEKEKKES